ncbi:DUF4386 domain-containing protein [Pseudoduganella sp. RAF53_2]|uniref:DUF4386 domain-containing protein n=1 Tax=unclassified Pseudoduganella TaxID=2637179 RepID=UPI003F9C79D4
MATSEQKQVARVAGLLYLIVVVTGIFSLGYVPSHVPPTEISSHLELYRLGIAAGLLCYVAFLLLPFALYRLLRGYGPQIAVLMVALAVVSVPISLLSLRYKLDVLTLVAQSAPQQQIDLALAAYGNGILIAKLFWGLWLLPFGYLAYRSGFIPRVLGMLLMLGCLGYLIDVFGRVLSPDFDANYVTLPSALGEIGTCLWLLAFSMRSPATVATVASE